jgi:predicted nucleic acid-binding protein
MDSLIAATANHYDLTIATRNVDDFNALPLKIINPFEMAS